MTESPLNRAALVAATSLCVLATAAVFARARQVANKATSCTQNNKDSSVPLSILEFELAAQTHASPLAQAYFNYYDGEGITNKTARQVFASIRLMPRILQGDLSDIDTKVELFGHSLKLPVFVAPTAFHSLACPEGEVATARGCGQAGAGYCYNWMLSSRPYLDVIEHPGVKWLQMYMFQEKHLVKESIRLAEESGAFSAIILTCDHPHTRVQNRMEPQFQSLMQAPKANEYDHFMFPNQAAAGGSQLTLGELVSGQGFDRTGTNSNSLSWDDIRWIKSLTSLPIVVKGVLSTQDAEKAVSAGASAIVVSNHGGRQFDGAPPAIEVLPAVVSAVRGRIPVLIDSGIRTSIDIVKCICMGAHCVMLGRPALWALSCGGSESLYRMLDHLQQDIANDLRSLGAKSIKDLKMDVVFAPDRDRIERDLALILPT
jgi:isopentenyl diphosphate isomerase/L-lactate dehydrogenase-like FMN-dependent dehydrogenase